MQVIVLTFPQNKCFTEKTTCPLSGMLISLVGWGIGFFFLARKAAKICKRNLDWKFGGINLCINLFLLGFINLQERKISLIISGKTSANFLNFFCLFHRQSIQMFLQIPEKPPGNFRELKSERERIVSVSISWMGINFESRWESYLESFIFIQTRKKTK